MADNQHFIGKYRIVEEIAGGAFGKVYRAEDTSRNNAVVAVKLLHAAYLRSSLERESFLHEAQFLTMLNHPYILPVLDVNIDKEFPYLVTEYAPGGSLYDRLKQQAPRPLNVAEALRILAQIGQALQYAHHQNIIHRDLKPENILFNASGDIFLADFGIAMLLATSVHYESAVGTPCYMAPEQFRGMISKEGDQYALGCIAYELLTGRVPYTAPDFFSLGFKHMSETPIAPTQLNLLLPRPVEQAILKAMAKQRTDRHADIAAFMAAAGAPDVTPAISAVPAAPTWKPSLYSSPFSTEFGAAGSEQTRKHDLENAIETFINPTKPVREETGKIVAIGKRHTSAPRKHPSVEAEETGKMMAVKARETARTGPKSISDEETGKNIAVRLRATEAPMRPEDSIMPFTGFTTIPATPATPVIPSTPSTPSTPVPSSRVSYPTLMPTIMNGHIMEQEGVMVNFQPQPSQPENTPFTTFSSAAWESLPAPPIPLMPLMPLMPLTPTIAVAQKRRGNAKKIWFIAAIIALVLLLAGGGTLYAMTGMFPHTTAIAHTHTGGSNSSPTSRTSRTPTTLTPITASVKITPSRKTINTTYNISAVTGSPSASNNQVEARYLSYTSGVQSKTISATGQGTTAATTATGTVSIYNSDPVNTTQVVAGSAFYSPDGSQFLVIDATLSIPPTGTTDFPAHSGNPGSSGNIPAGSFNFTYGWYNNSTITIDNITAMSGGLDASTYVYIQTGDMNNAATAASQLKSSLIASGQSSIAGQVRSNESQFGSTQCSPQITYNHKANDQASSVTASVSVTCSAEVYDQSGALTMGQQLLQNKPPTDYTIIGKITTSVTQVASGGNGTIVIHINATAQGQYQFSDAQKQGLAKLIVGYSESEAQSLLLKQNGVSQVVIQISSGQKLPGDPRQITIVVAS